MTRTAFIGDIHGYVPALERALEWCRSERVDSIVGLGDFIDGYDADEECVRLVREHFDVFVRGNHDEDDGAVLSDEAAQWLNSLPETICHEGWLVTHSTPRQHRKDEYIKSSIEAWNCFDDCDFQRCVVGHTHRPMLYRYRAENDIDCEALDVGDDGQILDPGKRYLLVNPSLAYNRSGQQNPGFSVFDSESQLLKIVYLNLPQITG